MTTEIENSAQSPEQSAVQPPVGSESGTASPSGVAASGTHSEELPDLPATDNPFDLDFTDQDDNFEELEVVAPKPAAAPAKTADPAAKPGEQKPAGQAPAPAAAPQKPAEGAKPEAPKAPEAQASEQPTVQKTFSQVLSEVAESTIPELAKMYSIPPDQAKHFTAEQLPALQTLAGTMHMNMLRAVSAMMENMVPQMLSQHQTRATAETKAQEDFFKAWPQLTREHVPVISKWGKLWAAGNPAGKVEDYIKAVGMMAMQELGLQGAPAQQQPQGGQPPAGQQQRTVRTVPFAPVTGGSAAPGGKPKPAASGIDWGGLGESMDQLE